MPKASSNEPEAADQASGPPSDEPPSGELKTPIAAAKREMARRAAMGISAAAARREAPSGEPASSEDSLREAVERLQRASSQTDPSLGDAAASSRTQPLSSPGTPRIMPAAESGEMLTMPSATPQPIGHERIDQTFEEALDAVLVARTTGIQTVTDQPPAAPRATEQVDCMQTLVSESDHAPASDAPTSDHAPGPGPEAPAPPPPLAASLPGPRSTGPAPCPASAMAGPRTTPMSRQPPTTSLETQPAAPGRALDTPAVLRAKPAAPPEAPPPSDEMPEADGATSTGVDSMAPTARLARDDADPFSAHATARIDPEEEARRDRMAALWSSGDTIDHTASEEAPAFSAHAPQTEPLSAPASEPSDSLPADVFSRRPATERLPDEPPPASTPPPAKLAAELFDAALTAHRQGDYEQTRQHLEQAVKLDPDSSVYQTNLRRLIKKLEEA